MAICKFFQEGNCRFGNRCWNEHIQNTRYSHQYNDQKQSNQFQSRQVHQTQPSSSSGFSFKAALQHAGQPQRHQPQPQTPSLGTGGRFSFTSAFNAIQSTPSFGNHLQSPQRFSTPIVNPPSFGFQSQNVSTFGQNAATFGQSSGSQMGFFGSRSTFGASQSQNINNSYSDIDMNISESNPSVSFDVKPQPTFVSQSIVHSPGGDNLETSSYSTLDSLTAEELNSFKANEFTFMQIPIIPPPRELCF